jgi:hypothetical protein
MPFSLNQGAIMKFVQLPMKSIPKQLTAKHRPASLGEMRQAFLNANNKKSWAEDDEYPDRPPRRPFMFTTRKQVKNALRRQKQILAVREEWYRKNEIDSKIRLQDRDKSPLEAAIFQSLMWRDTHPELLLAYLCLLKFPEDAEFNQKLHECYFNPATGHISHGDDVRWDRGDKPTMSEQLHIRMRS